MLIVNHLQSHKNSVQICSYNIHKQSNFNVAILICRIENLIITYILGNSDCTDYILNEFTAFDRIYFQYSLTSVFMSADYFLMNVNETLFNNSIPCMLSVIRNEKYIKKNEETIVYNVIKHKEKSLYDCVLRGLFTVHDVQFILENNNYIESILKELNGNDYFS
jgi:hypothetical protein